MAINEVVTLILLLQNLQGIWCDNIPILNQLIRQMNPITTTSIIFSSYIVKVYPQMVNSLHDQ